jgi:hypothetical protein
VRAPVPAGERGAYLALGNVNVKTPESFNLSPLANTATDDAQAAERQGRSGEEKAA